MQPEVKTTDTVNFDFVTQPLFWWQQFKREKVFIGNLSGCYCRYEKAIKRIFPASKFIEIYEEEKIWYAGYVDRNCKNQFEKDCLLGMEKNPTINAKCKDRMMKLFFAHLKENKLDAKNYIDCL